MSSALSRFVSRRPVPWPVSSTKLKIVGVSTRMACTM